MGKILNEGLNWDRLPDYGGQTREEIHRAFFGRPVKNRFPVGFQLYKLHNYSKLSIDRSPKTFVSGWWAPFNPFEWDPGFRERVKFALDMAGVTLRELSRLFLAVCEDWNSFDYLVKISLSEPVYGFYGSAAGQPRKHPGSKSLRRKGEGAGPTRGLPGHGLQVYIPFLTLAHITDERGYPIGYIERRMSDIARGVSII